MMKAKDSKTRETDEVSLAKKRGKWRRFASEQLAPMAFIGPHLFFFGVFFVFPFFYGIYISFTQWDMMSDPTWVGLKNYISVLTPGTIFNENFVDGLIATLTYTVCMVPLLIAVPLALAVWLNSIKNKRLRAVFQAVLYAPSLLSVATVALSWRWLLDREMGAVNNLLLSDINWTGDQPFAWIAIFALTLWSGIGGNMIIFMSGLSGVPQSYYEAARIDGANAWQQFWKITLPSLRFQMLYAIVMGTIGGFNVFGQPYMFGGPRESTTTLMMYIQQYAFGSSTPNAGMASAMSVLLGLIIAVFSIIQFRMMSRKER